MYKLHKIICFEYECEAWKWNNQHNYLCIRECITFYLCVIAFICVRQIRWLSECIFLGNDKIMKIYKEFSFNFSFFMMMIPFDKVCVWIGASIESKSEQFEHIFFTHMCVCVSVSRDIEKINSTFQLNRVSNDVLWIMFMGFTRSPAYMVMILPDSLRTKW